MKEKALLVGIVLVMAGLASANFFVAEKKEVNISMISQEYTIKAIKAKGHEHLLRVEGKEIKNAFRPIAKPMNIPVANTEDTEYHPTIASSGTTLFAGYAYSTSLLEQDIYMVLSTDGGQTFTPAGYWTVEGVEDYPSFDHWGGNTYYGTFMPDPNTPYTYLMRINDITDTATWELVYYDWSSYGWYDMQAPTMACHNSQDPWEFGVIGFIASTDYESAPCVSAPHMFFADPTEQGAEGYAYISWWSYNNSAHATATIDKATDMIYCAYDWYNETSATYNILVWGRSYEDPLEGESWLYEIPSTFYAQYPAIAAHDGHVVVLCQSDEHINQDIACFYSSDGGATWELSYVTNSPEDDLYPSAVVSGDKIICTFVRNGDLYYTYSEDWGATWEEPIKLNDVDGSVASEWRTAGITESGAVWTDTRDGNADIYYNSFPVPVLTAEITGGFGVTVTVSNVGTAAAENVPWSIELSGGLILMGGKKEGTIPSLAPGESTTIKSGLILGIGKTTITATVGGTSITASGFLLGPFVLGVK